MIIGFDAVQQEVWDTLCELNAAWTRGNPDDLVHYFHPGMIAVTASDRYRREGRRVCMAGWKGFAQQNKIVKWRENDPVVRVFGNAAVVAYYFEIAFETAGRVVTLDGRDTYFFVKEEGRWWAVADHYSPYPGGKA
jgi:hypothetical protein